MLKKAVKGLRIIAKRQPMLNGLSILFILSSVLVINNNAFSTIVTDNNMVEPSLSTRSTNETPNQSIFKGYDCYDDKDDGTR